MCKSKCDSECNSCILILLQIATILLATAALYFACSVIVGVIFNFIKPHYSDCTNINIRLNMDCYLAGATVIGSVLIHLLCGVVVIGIVFVIINYLILKRNLSKEAIHGTVRPRNYINYLIFPNNKSLSVFILILEILIICGFVLFIFPFSDKIFFKSHCTLIDYYWLGNGNSNKAENVTNVMENERCIFRDLMLPAILSGSILLVSSCVIVYYHGGDSIYNNGGLWKRRNYLTWDFTQPTPHI